MITELEPRAYEKVRPLFIKWRSQLVIFAVIEGKVPGRIYVDDADHPRTAFLWDHVEGEFYLAGYAHNEAFNQALNDCIRHRIRCEAQAQLPHLSEFTLYCDPDVWGSELEVVLKGTNPMEQRRKHFTFKQLRVDWRSRVPEGFSMVPMDAALFERRELGHMETMIEWVLGSWRSPADFADTDVGFCLIHGDELVSWCASEYTSHPILGGGRECQVGIYTSEGYRRQGFATLTASATVEGCLAKGIERIAWLCWSSNVGSAATAEKVGFELTAEYPVWNACFNPFDNLLLQAHYYSQAQRREEALARWEQAFEMWEAGDAEALGSPHLRLHPDTVRWCYYAAARAWAQQGDPEAAFRNLNKAVDNGWRDVAQLRAEQDLAPLHGTPAWEALLARLETLVQGKCG